MNIWVADSLFFSSSKFLIFRAPPFHDVIDTVPRNRKWMYCSYFHCALDDMLKFFLSDCHSGEDCKHMGIFVLFCFSLQSKLSGDMQTFWVILLNLTDYLKALRMPYWKIWNSSVHICSWQYWDTPNVQGDNSGYASKSPNQPIVSFTILIVTYSMFCIHYFNTIICSFVCFCLPPNNICIVNVWMIKQSILRNPQVCHTL